jgi:hypothetical protein
MGRGMLREAYVANHVVPILVTASDRTKLERLQQAPSTPAGLSRQARAVLLMAQGLSGVEIAERIGYTLVQVSRMRRRYADGGVAGLHDRPKSGRPATITARKRAQIVALTLKPPGWRGPWTARDLARTTGCTRAVSGPFVRSCSIAARGARHVVRGASLVASWAYVMGAASGRYWRHSETHEPGLRRTSTWHIPLLLSSGVGPNRDASDSSLPLDPGAPCLPSQSVGG